MTTSHSAPCGKEDGHFPHHVPLIVSRFRIPGRRFVRSRARLFGDRIELEGWTLRGRFYRCLRLASIAHLESHANADDPHLTLFLENEEVLHLYMDDAFKWRALFENWVRYDVLPSAKLVGGVDQAAALAG